MIDSKTKIITFALILFGWFIFSPTLAQAQKLILTYQDISFYPSNYQGKAPGAFGSKILVRAVGINDDGKIVDLSKADFSWRTDLNYSSFGGTGMDQIVIDGSKFEGDWYAVGVQATFNNKVYNGSISIPASSAEGVIEAPVYNNVLFPGQNIKLKLTPYFFNINSLDDLKFIWKVNSTNAGKKNILTLNVDEYYTEPIKNSITIRINNLLVVGNIIQKENLLGSAKDKINFQIKPYEN